MIWINVFFNMVIACCALWLMASSQQPRTVRVIMAVILVGCVAYVAESVWLNNMQAWPGELISSGGIALLLVRYIYNREQSDYSTDRISVKSPS